MNMHEEEHPRSHREPLNRLEAVIRVRCPECRKGIVYRNGMEMNRLCPYCGIKFNREPGYFSGSIWISTIIATPVMLFAMFCLLYFFRGLHPALAGILAALSFIPLVPLTIRLSRSLWMYLDHQMNPQRGNRRPPDDSDGKPPEPSPEGPGHGNAAAIPAAQQEQVFVRCVERSARRESALHPTQ